MKMIYNIFIVTIFSFILANSAMAFGLSDLAGSKDKEDTPKTDCEKMQDILLKDFQTFTTEQLKTKGELLEAIGDANGAKKLKEKAKKISGKVLEDKADVKDVSKASKSSAKTVMTVMKTPENLSIKSAAHFLKATQEYVKNIQNSKQMLSKLDDFAKLSLTDLGKASFTDKIRIAERLKTGKKLVSELPKIYENDLKVIASIVSFAKSSRIELPKDMLDLIALL